jgi:mono/diheme cytochrome c family protein
MKSAAASLFALVSFARLATTAAADDLSPAQQTSLVKKYCAVCHTDASNNGGLSLQHYDAAVSDAPLAAMILSKLRNGAMGAAGIGIPEPTLRDAWTAATIKQAAGATVWHVTQTPTLAASIVRQVPVRKPADTNIPVYRLTLSCNPATHHADVQLAWSPEPQTNRTFFVAVDGQPAVAHTLAGQEHMGNGASVTTGLASAMLHVPMPVKTLTVTDLFPGETVTFPIGIANFDLDRGGSGRACSTSSGAND